MRVRWVQGQPALLVVPGEKGGERDPGGGQRPFHHQGGHTPGGNPAGVQECSQVQRLQGGSQSQPHGQRPRRPGALPPKHPRAMRTAKPRATQMAARVMRVERMQSGHGPIAFRAAGVRRRAFTTCNAHTR